MRWLSRLRRRARKQDRQSHSVRDYRALVRAKLKALPDDPALALAQAIGAPTMADFVSIGDGHVAVLRHHGLTDGMAVYDLGCGCGRTAQALVRAGWQGRYTGADVVQELLDELSSQCPGYVTLLNVTPQIVAPDASLNMVFHWSVFTHLYPGESYLYMADAFRALKPGGKMIFSFLELEESLHDRVWHANLDHLRAGHQAEHLDAFLHREWIRRFAREAGFSEPCFTDGSDDRHHPPFWQSLAVLEKPVA
ncbi:class I SAM-dependent methyltransferase (plasmid) [Sphingobium sp. V4]|uniref:class I SAM-dependent methyltransferase n=1 Tax=Sphingobium sp. V4 TaxID=3038927 RepID=UPI00255801D7|nr:class I SAM-dependent methyltransferase [Sphingobium sp. V4]WIW91136.1 class I SAM-dependent methyltransferase [Sphingobium sp. V4]